MVVYSVQFYCSTDPRNSMNLKSLVITTNCILGFAIAASPVSASPVACASGNLSTVDGTTCDIGNLQFTYTGLSSFNGGGTVGSTPWTDSDFTFTVLSNGFQLSGPPPQTLTSVVGEDEGWEDYANLTFNVTDLNGLITGWASQGVLLRSRAYPPARITKTLLITPLAYSTPRPKSWPKTRFTV